uniref:Uncharacterized protein n=1 Tax=Oryza meridionalis TaxID=40149 RepID=A0A0E0EWN9_9ORYZ
MGPLVNPSLSFSAHLPPASPRCGAATRRGSCTRLRTRTTRSTSYTRRACRVPPLGAWRARPGPCRGTASPSRRCTQGYTRTSPGPRRRRAHVAGSVNWCCLRCASSGAMRTTWPSATSRGRCCATFRAGRRWAARSGRTSRCSRAPTWCSASPAATFFLTRVLQQVEHGAARGWPG